VRVNWSFAVAFSIDQSNSWCWPSWTNKVNQLQKIKEQKAIRNLESKLDITTQSKISRKIVAINASYL
jgi:hypothetical protein